MVRVGRPGPGPGAEAASRPCIRRTGRGRSVARPSPIARRRSPRSASLLMWSVNPMAERRTSTPEHSSLRIGASNVSQRCGHSNGGGSRPRVCSGRSVATGCARIDDAASSEERCESWCGRSVVIDVVQIDTPHSVGCRLLAGWLGVRREGVAPSSATCRAWVRAAVTRRPIRPSPAAVMKPAWTRWCG